MKGFSKPIIKGGIEGNNVPCLVMNAVYIPNNVKFTLELNLWNVKFGADLDHWMQGGSFSEMWTWKRVQNVR